MKYYSILLLTTVMEPGGAQKAMLQLARGLRDLGAEVIVVTMYDKGDFVPDFERRFGLPIIDLGMKGSAGRSLFSRGWLIWRGLWRLFWLLRRERVTILQTFTHYSNILGPVLGWLSGVPIRVSSQRNNLAGQPWWLVRADRLVANSWLTHRMVSVSEMTRQYCIGTAGIRAEKVLTIPNGLDPARFADAADQNNASTLRQELGLMVEDLVVTVVARLHPQKGHRDLISAIPAILERVPQAVFLLVGDGELREEIEGMIRKRGLERSVLTLGARHDVPKLLAISDLFVLPSLWEGMPNAVMEAMAAGLPVVATRVDGTPEVVVEGQTGLLVPPGEAPELAAAVVDLLTDAPRREAMGVAGKTRILTEFSLDTSVERFLELYLQLLSERRVRRVPSNTRADHNMPDREDEL
jgi:glycosyltransferase involved in cell wall biosynthesis